MMNRDHWICKEDAEDACSISPTETMKRINAESIQKSCTKFLTLIKKSMMQMRSIKKKRNKALQLILLMILIFQKNAINLTRNKSSICLMQELKLMISSICAAKSKFLKKEKSCALMMKLNMKIFMISIILQKKFMINFEIALKKNYIFQLDNFKINRIYNYFFLLFQI